MRWNRHMNTLCWLTEQIKQDVGYEHRQEVPSTKMSEKLFFQLKNRVLKLIQKLWFLSENILESTAETDAINYICFQR